MKERFAEAVVRMLEEKVTGCSMKVTQMNKNNCSVNTGIEFKVDGESITPVFYLDDFFEAYVDGVITLEETADRIAEWYKNHEMEKVKVVIPQINREWIEKNVVFCLVNADMNREMLKGVPHRMFEDLAVIYRCFVQRDGYNLASMIVKNEMAYMNDMSEQELYEAAQKNTKEKSKFEVMTIGSLVGGVDSPLWVLTNGDGAYGASILLYKEYFERLSEELEEDLIVFPSSIHEVLACQASVVDVDKARELVRGINMSAVEPVDVLGGNVYIYSRETGELRIA